MGSSRGNVQKEKKKVSIRQLGKLHMNIHEEILRWGHSWNKCLVSVWSWTAAVSHTSWSHYTPSQPGRGGWGRTTHTHSLGLAWWRTGWSGALTVRWTAYAVGKGGGGGGQRINIITVLESWYAMPTLATHSLKCPKYTSMRYCD